jgi:hypothetical protein
MEGNMITKIVMYLDAPLCTCNPPKPSYSDANMQWLLECTKCGAKVVAPADGTLRVYIDMPKQPEPKKEESLKPVVESVLYGLDGKPLFSK